MPSNTEWTPTILIASPDEALCKKLSERLIREGFAPKELSHDCKLHRLLGQTRFDCIIGEAGSHESNAKELLEGCQEEESLNSSTPVFVIYDAAAEGELEGLDFAEAFIKPISEEFEEQLVGRLKAIRETKRPAVLVVEDELRLCKLLERKLLREGYDVMICKSKLEALQTLASRAFDCILLDLQLENGKGEEVVVLARKGAADAKNGATPIVVMSGKLDRNVLTRIGRKISDAIVKPFDDSTLLGKLKKATEVA